jgi:hypothetical protein
VLLVDNTKMLCDIVIVPVVIDSSSDDTPERLYLEIEQ